MNTWSQDYNPLGSIELSALIAVLPILFFILALTILKLSGPLSAFFTLIVALVISTLMYKMPIPMAVLSAVFGIIGALWPIGWIIFTALFLYKITVKAGQFEVIRSSIASISADQRVQLLLIGFAFNAFLEGAVGFGVPIAICAAILVNLGYAPLRAASLCLVANAASGAFGAIGIPVIVASQVSGITKEVISQILSYQLPIISFFIPFILVAIVDGWKGIRQTFPVLFITALSYSLTQYATLVLLGPELPNIISSLICMGSIAIFSRYWKPKQIFTYSNKTDRVSQVKSTDPLTFGKVALAWSPFYLLTLFITIWNLPAFKNLFSKGNPLAITTTSFPLSGLHELVLKVPPIASKITPYPAIIKLDWLASTGTAIFLSALISVFLFHVSFLQFNHSLKETAKELWRPLITIAFVLSFAQVSNFSGISSTLGLALSKTGSFFPFVSPLIGWIGVFLTGSVVSNNALFGNLQVVTAQQIGVNPAVLISANTSGGVMGKLLSPQSIAIASVAVNETENQGTLFRNTILYSLGLLVMVSLFTYFLAQILT